MNERFERILKEFMEGNLPNVKTYGYTMYRGPDGVPHVREFGTGFNETAPASLQEGVREPLADVTVEGDTVRVVVELPGVNKQDIELETTEESMCIRVNTEKRRFQKTVALTTAVDPESARAEYNNGILEVTLHAKNKGVKAKRIDIL
jgi:HSP20 family protein